ncbi:MAG: hypothetical protein JXX14_19760 [Deltaproteobacteria bacterium]|nr:hypothetical protein [Deltaproteobacteria bacterium]
MKLAESGFPIALEAPAITLEMIAAVDRKWINNLKKLIQAKQISFIGSGYTQLIGPLVPWKVNHWNQKLGKQIYQSLLDTCPSIALVNEMAFAPGIVSHYLEHGYCALVLDWNNPYKYHSEWSKEYQYHYQFARGLKEQIQVIWSNSISFQKFQRFVHAELAFDDYMSWLQKHERDNTVRYMALYSGDTEIFNYRPGRYHTEEALRNNDEWATIKQLLEQLQKHNKIKLVSIDAPLKETCKNAGNLLALESPQQPISVKKQEKYNIIRWALTGRNDRHINTLCQRIYHGLSDTDDEAAWRELCYLWSSDFRTHISDARWDEYVGRLSATVTKYVHQPKTEVPQREQSLPFNHNGVRVSKSGELLHIESDVINMTLNLRRGMTISQLAFPDIDKQAIIGTLEHGYYDDIAFGADFYSGHVVVEKLATHKSTDLQLCSPQIFVREDCIVLETSILIDEMTVKKQIKYDGNTHELTLTNKIVLPSRTACIIRPMHLTVNPIAFDQHTLYFSTHNGGQELEHYSLTNNEIRHFEPLSPLISSKHGLGATEGVVIIGDKNRQIVCRHDNTVGYVIPAVRYATVDDNNYFLRIQYSAQELDETFRGNDSPQTIAARVRISVKHTME